MRSAVKLNISLRKAAALNILKVKLFWCKVLDGIEIAQKAFPPHAGCNTGAGRGTNLSIVRDVSISDKVAANLLVDLDNESQPLSKDN